MRFRLSLFAVIFCLFSFIRLQSSVMAASCDSDEPSYGEASYMLGTLPDTGIYTIWTRMQAADSIHNRYQLEVNDEACFTIGGSGVSENQWEWVNFQNGDRDNVVRYTFTETTGNTIRMLGIDPAVKIDTVLVVADDCVPEELGDNCRNATSIGTVPQSVSSDINGPVSGTVAFSSLFLSQDAEVQSVEYSVGGQRIQKSEGAVGLDTTLLSNGEHEVTARVTYTDGTVASETHTIEVDNPTTALSPVLRWMRLNTGLLALIGFVLGLISLIGLIFMMMRRMHLRKLYERTHGLH